MVQTRGGGTWGSMLSTGEFAAVCGVGFEPVGQVFGACVYNIGYVGAFGCAGGWSSSDPGPARARTRVSGEGGFGVRPLIQAIYEARHKAIDRMTAECAALGGYGIVGGQIPPGTGAARCGRPCPTAPVQLRSVRPGLREAHPCGLGAGWRGAGDLDRGQTR